jgi:hypothetical protein
MRHHVACFASPQIPHRFSRAPGHPNIRSYRLIKPQFSCGSSFRKSIVGSHILI